MVQWFPGAVIVLVIVFFCGCALFCEGNAEYLRRGGPIDGGDPALRGQGCTAMLMIVVSGILLVFLVALYNAGIIKT